MYKRRLNDSYEVVALTDGELAIHEMEMLRRNRIETLLPIELMIEDGVCQLWYQITGLQAMDTLIKTGHFGVEELQTLLTGLRKTVDDMERFLLREASISLSRIYFSPDGKRVYFSYCPAYMKYEINLKDQMVAMLDELVKEADYTKKEYVSLLFQVYEELSLENGSISRISLEVMEKKGVFMEADEMLERNIEDERQKTEKRHKKLDDTQIEQEHEGFLEKMKTKLREAAVNKVKDEVWNVKKTARKYTDFKTVAFSETEYVEPLKVQEHPTQYLGEIGVNSKKEAHLKIGEEQEEVLLARERVILGKKEGYADVIIQDPTVSRMHAMIEKREEGYFIEDLNSLNGTSVNGKLIGMKQAIFLSDRDEIKMGNTNLIFHYNP